MIGSGRTVINCLMSKIYAPLYICATKEKNLVNDTFNIRAKAYTTMKRIIRRCSIEPDLVAYYSTPRRSVIWTASGFWKRSGSPVI